jgi:hypothetical protein
MYSLANLIFVAVDERWFEAGTYYYERMRLRLCRVVSTDKCRVCASYAGYEGSGHFEWVQSAWNEINISACSMFVHETQVHYLFPN